MVYDLKGKSPLSAVDDGTILFGAASNIADLPSPFALSTMWSYILTKLGFTVGPGPAAVAGSVMGITSLIEPKEVSNKLQAEAGIWSGTTQTFLGVSQEFGASDGSTLSPTATLFAYANNTGSDGDVVAVIGDAVARTNGGSVFGGNLIVRNDAGVNGAKLCGLEIDIEPAPGTTISANSIGLAINVFSIATGAPAIQLGGLGGGSFANGLLIHAVDGAGVAAQAGTTMQSLIDTGVATYNTAAIAVSNTHKILFRGTASTHAKIYNDASNNLRIVNGAGLIAFRNKTDTASIVGVSDEGILSFGTTGTINFNTALTAASATSGGASALPATPAGYTIQQVNGSTVKVPYYNV